MRDGRRDPYSLFCQAILVDDAPAAIDEAERDLSSGGVHYHCAIVSEAVKKLFAGDRQLIMNMRSWHHE